MKQLYTVHIIMGLVLLVTHSWAQFAPPAGEAGTSAMHKDSSAFISWASKCKISRGLQDISIPTGAYATVGDSSSVLGVAGLNGLVSLGDGGEAMVEFTLPITNGIGHDFAVFENSFDGAFLELAFVEVSSDGTHFFRFPAISHTDTLIQTGSFGLTDAKKIHNLAGKYKVEYGTPFDLDDIADHSLLNKQAITHVKIIDVVGCIQNQYCTRDANGHKINDPWPTAFDSGGFDLDAVGVIHQQQIQTGIEESELDHITVYPNPVADFLTLTTRWTSYSITLTSSLGEELLTRQEVTPITLIHVGFLTRGIYYLTISNHEYQKKTIKLIKS